MKNLIYGILLFGLGQSLIWFQTNGQFIWPWFKKNPLILSIFGGTLISYIFINATEYIYRHYDGLVWPGRFIGFSIGITVFAALTYHLLGESMNLKTVVSLMLAITIILIQLFWK